MEPRLSPSQRRVLSASRRLPSLEPPSSAQLAGCTRRPLSASPRAAQLSSGRARTPSADDGRAAAAAGAAQRVHAASLAASEVRSLEQPLPPFVAAATNAPLLELLRWLQRSLVVADASAAGAPVVFASAGAAALLGARDVVGVPIERLLGREQLGGTLRGLGVAAPRGAKGGTA